MNSQLKISKGFVKGLILIIVFFGLVYIYINYNEFKLSREMNSIDFPDNYQVISKEYTSRGISNDASLSYTYKVSGTREDVYRQVVKSLGLNEQEHQETYDQDLNGVGSPKYKGLFFLRIEPRENDFMENDPCLANGEDDLEWKICRNKDPNRGKNLAAQYMNLLLVDR